MNALMLIAKAEWRYWLRSQLFVSASVIFTVIIIATSGVTSVRMIEQSHLRNHHQEQAEQTFYDQPDRHPHRMVHYGHYLFRTPAALSIFDPGLDSVTGQSIFLEGHQQNTAMFANSGDSADLGGFAWLTPALVYQLLAPLIIILLGYASVTREREGGLLPSLIAQGVSYRTIVFGKLLALKTVVGLLLIPLAVLAIIAVAYDSGDSAGDSLLAAGSLLMLYGIYLLSWAVATIIASALFQSRSTVLAALTTGWLIITLVVPALAVNLATGQHPIAGKIETDLTMRIEKARMADGHNAKDPAFAKLRDELLARYQVASVDQLPVNFRGLVALNSEEKLTDLLNKFANERMTAELQQASLIAQFAWVSPAIATASGSRALVGTDLKHYHEFLRQAELVRFDFVQSLNRVHFEQLSYIDDINRNKGDEAWAKARVSSDNWRGLENFSFTPADSVHRLRNASAGFLAGGTWLIVLLALLFWAVSSPRAVVRS